MKTLLAAGVATLALATSALAADLPSRKAPPPVAPVVYAPVFTWTGAYLGVNAGYGWGKVTKSGSFFNKPNGFVGGGQIGYNYQMGNIVLGAEADIQYSGLEAQAKADTTAIPVINGKLRPDWFGTVRPRVGYAIDRTLLYVTGGLAYGNQKLSVDGLGSGSNTSVGWTAGAGAEYAFTNNFTGKVEGLYVNLGDHTYTFTTPAVKAGTEFGVVRAGLNYKF